MNTRASAAIALTSVIEDKQSIKLALKKVAIKTTDGRDRAFVQELVYGVCRWFYSLENDLQQLLNKPLRGRDLDIKCLLLIGLYQLKYLETPHHALVKETVDATLNLKKNWARKLVNATLRNAIRRNLHEDDAAAEHETSRNLKLNNPSWLVATLQKDWPEQAEDILAAYNKHPPLTLRVNTRQILRTDYIKTLSNAKIAATPTQHSPVGVQLPPTAIAELPNFYDGFVSVQDEAAQLAGLLVDPQPGNRILDACAAPGGKSGHIGEITGSGNTLFTLDVDESRVKLIEENLTRLKLDANIIQGDATQPTQWWDGEPFDKILIDAPCSATGIIRRQPDVKLHREPEDIVRLSSLQLKILKSMWPLLVPGGTIIYATCSIFRQENDEVIRAFSRELKDCVVQVISEKWGTATEFGRQILPGNSDMDGFFYSAMKKTW